MFYEILGIDSHLYKHQKLEGKHRTTDPLCLPYDPSRTFAFDFDGSFFALGLSEPYTQMVPARCGDPATFVSMEFPRSLDAS